MTAEKTDLDLMNSLEFIKRHELMSLLLHLGEDLKAGSFDFEVSDGLNEASKETFKISIRKPELVEYEGRVWLPVFPLTQAPIKPENLLVRSSDGREINFKVVPFKTFTLWLVGWRDGLVISVPIFPEFRID